MQLNNYLQGKEVDEKQIRGFTNKLSKFDPGVLLQDDFKKAFWINLYNGLTNHFIIKYQVTTSVLEIEGFFSKLNVQVGDLSWSLDDIEHGVLRRNGQRRNQKPRQFGHGDPKQQFMVTTMDPRIHFALNCGGKSCPPIAFYHEERIEDELSLATSNFVESGFIVNHKKKEISCSSVFDWYKQDFGKSFLGDPSYEGYQVHLTPYHWTLQ